MDKMLKKYWYFKFGIRYFYRFCWEIKKIKIIFKKC